MFADFLMLFLLVFRYVSYEFLMISVWLSYDVLMISECFSYDYHVICPWFSYGSSMVFLSSPNVFLRFSYGFPEALSDGFPMVVRWFPFGFPGVFLWFPNDLHEFLVMFDHCPMIFLMVSRLCAYVFLMVSLWLFLWCSYDFTWFSYDVHVICPWFSYGSFNGFPVFPECFLLVLLWSSDGFPEAFLWFSSGFPMVFLRFAFSFPHEKIIGKS